MQQKAKNSYFFVKRLLRFLKNQKRGVVVLTLSSYDKTLTRNALPLNKKDPCGSFKNRKRRDSNPRGRLLHLTP